MIKKKKKKKKEEEEKRDLIRTGRSVSSAFISLKKEKKGKGRGKAGRSSGTKPQ